jgi:hypothetical protein
MNRQPFHYTPTADSADTVLHRPGASLTVVAPEADSGRSAVVDADGTVLGRAAGSGLALTDEKVSRRHAVVRLRVGRYEVSDLDSTNGTLVNGERVVGVRPLRDGDRIELGASEIVFRLAPAEAPPPQHARPRADQAWRPEDATAALPRDPAGGSGSLRQKLKDSSSFSPKGLALAVGGSVVGTVLTSAVGSGPWGTLAGAALTPVVTTAFATRRAGEKGRARTAVVAILSVAALTITWAGFTAADTAAGKPVIPGASDQAGTFPGVEAQALPAPAHRTTTRGPTPTNPASGAAVDCGTTAVGSTANCAPAILTYRASGSLTIRSLEVNGNEAGEFSAETECVGRTLTTGESCETSVTFTPAAEGTRTATLIIHQSLPPPDRGSRFPLTGTGRAGSTEPGCLPGFVWREAVAEDHVCVTPETRAQVRQDNELADSRRSTSGGPFGPDTCLPGFVWREATAGDHVCVTPETRSQAQQDNELADSRRAG